MVLLELFESCAKIKINMHTRLFVTVSAAIVVGLLVAYAVIIWHRNQMQKLLVRATQAKGEIGFAAITKQRAEMVQT